MSYTSFIRFMDDVIEKAKFFGLFALILLVTMSYAPDGSDTRQFQEKLMVLSIMAYGSLYFGNFWATIFFLLNTVLLINNGLDVGVGQTLNLFACFFLFAVSRAFFTTNKTELITNVIKCILTLNLVWMFLQVLSIDPLFIGRASYGPVLWGQSFNLPIGLFHLQAALGMFLALCTPFLIKRGWTIPLLLTIPIILTSCAVAILAHATMLLYGAFYIRMVTFKRKIFYFIITAIVVLGACIGVFSDYTRDKLTGGSRFENWHLYIRSALQKPLFGYGPDSFRNLTPSKKYNFYSDEDYNPMVIDYSNPEKPMARYHSADEGKRIDRFGGREPKHYAIWQEAHNEYIQIFFEYGLLGLLICFGFMKDVYKRFRLSIDSVEVRVFFGAVLCYLIFSITQFPFHLARIALFLPVILGAFFAKTDKDWDTFVKGVSND